MDKQELEQYTKKLTQEEKKRIDAITKSLLKELWYKGFSLNQMEVISNKLTKNIQKEV